MKDNNKIPKFAHLQYEVMHELDITIPEYFLLDMIHHLSRGGWCNKKLDNIAYDMRMTKRGITVMRDRLIKRKLLIKGVSNRLKTSEKVNSMYFLDESVLKKSELSSKKVNSVQSKSELNVAKTPVEINKRLTKKEEVDFRGIESPAKERLRAFWKGKGLLPHARD